MLCSGLCFGGSWYLRLVYCDAKVVYQFQCDQKNIAKCL